MGAALNVAVMLAVGGDVARAAAVDVAWGVVAAVALAVRVDVTLGGAVEFAGMVGMVRGDGDGAAVAISAGGDVTATAVGRSVDVADGMFFRSTVRVISTSSACAVGVAVFALGALAPSADDSSTSRNVDPPIIQPAISSAQRAPGKTSR